LLRPRVVQIAGAGQVDLERRPAALFAPHVDVAAVLLHDAVDHREPETGSAALVLGREERLEDSRLDLAAHPDAVVADGEAEVRSGRGAGMLAHEGLVELDVGRVDRERPPRGIASRALIARFIKICSSWVGSALTRSRCAFGTVVKRRCARRSAAGASTPTR
jgi:hypothetical protein